MRQVLAVLLVAVIGLAAGVRAEEKAADPSADTKARVDGLYAEGKKAAKAKDFATAAAKWEEALRLDPKSWEVLNHYGWFLIDTAPEGIKNVDKGLELALRANELVGGKNKDVLDTVAEGYYAKKDYAKAVEFGKKAIEPNLEGAHSKPEYLQKQLAKFQKALDEANAAK